MPKKKNISFEQAESLFKKVNGEYVRKEDEDFVNAFMQIMPGTNQNDTPFTKTQIVLQHTWDEFSFSGKEDFIYICDLRADAMILKPDIRNWDNEKIYPHNFTSKANKEIFDKYIGGAYVLTCVINNHEYIVKFGSTRTPFKARLGSYNCGVINNLRTASTTNIKILQSFVACNTSFKLYFYPCGESASIEWRGEKSVPFATSKPLAVEDIMVKKYMEQFNQKPLSNIQAAATEVI